MPRAYLSLGANLGDAAAKVQQAIAELGAFGTVVRRSALYRTPPWGKLDQPDFVNAVALIETPLSPRELMNALQTLEKNHGRQPAERWAPRELDVDILTYDDATIDEPDLHVPHPHMHERAFVLVPLAEIDPAYTSLRDALPARELAGVTAIERL
jgi:2-amino-4-hydroxy-6-hydroxymethyldihydropteridine diphosphokinase